MTAPVITFFNNKGGVGKTSLVYHIAWMMSLQGRIVVAADLDPQANLTANFLDEDQLERIWSPAGTEKASRTVYEHVAPLIKGTGDIADPTLVGIGEPDQFELNSRIFVFPGDLSLSLLRTISRANGQTAWTVRNALSG